MTSSTNEIQCPKCKEWTDDQDPCCTLSNSEIWARFEIAHRELTKLLEESKNDKNSR